MKMSHNHMDHSVHSMGHNHTMDHSLMGHDHNMDHSDHMNNSAAGHMDVDHSSHSGHGSHSMMMMYFHTGYKEMILFSFWDTSTMNGFVFSLVGIFIAAMLYEGLKYFREYLFMKSYESLKYSSMTSVDRNATTENKKKIRLNMRSKDHCFQTVLHLARVVLSYNCLMLIFMIVYLG